MKKKFSIYLLEEHNNWKIRKTYGIFSMAFIMPEWLTIYKSGVYSIRISVLFSSVHFLLLL